MGLKALRCEAPQAQKPSYTYVSHVPGLPRPLRRPLHVHGVLAPGLQNGARFGGGFSPASSSSSCSAWCSCCCWETKTRWRFKEWGRGDDGSLWYCNRAPGASFVPQILSKSPPPHLVLCVLTTPRSLPLPDWLLRNAVQSILQATAHHAQHGSIHAVSPILKNML